MIFDILIALLPIFGSIKQIVYPDILSSEEEKHYLRLMKFNNDEARCKLIEHNLRLVCHIVKKFDNLKDIKDDLIQVGSYGLIKAIDSYNIDSDVRLATYASKCIENEILMYLRRNKKTMNDISIYNKIGEDKDGNEIKIIDVVQSDNISNLDKIINEENIKLVLDSLKILSKRELEILEIRFGLNGKKVLTQTEISKKYHISRSYVSRIEKRALSKLYLHLKKESE